MMTLFLMIPAYVVHMILFTGIIGCAIGFGVLRGLPIFQEQQLLLRFASVVLVIFGIWLEGVSAAASHYKAENDKLTIRALTAEKAAAQASSSTEIVYRDKVVVVKDTQSAIQSKIDKIAAAIDVQCKITPELIELLNASAQNRKLQ